MHIQAYDKTVNKHHNGEIKSMTVSFVNSPVMVHYRISKYGITSRKVSPKHLDRSAGFKMDSPLHGIDIRPFIRAADKLVFEMTGKTTWLRKPKATGPGIDSVSLEFNLEKV